MGKANSRLAELQRTERAKQSGSSMKKNTTTRPWVAQSSPNNIQGWHALLSGYIKHQRSKQVGIWKNPGNGVLGKM